MHDIYSKEEIAVLFSYVKTKKIRNKNVNVNNDKNRKKTGQ